MQRYEKLAEMAYILAVPPRQPVRPIGDRSVKQ